MSGFSIKGPHSKLRVVHFGLYEENSNGTASTMNKEAASSYEMSVISFGPTRRHVPEDFNLYRHDCEKHRTLKFITYFLYKKFEKNNKCNY